MATSPSLAFSRRRVQLAAPPTDRNKPRIVLIIKFPRESSRDEQHAHPPIFHSIFPFLRLAVNFLRDGFYDRATPVKLITRIGRVFGEEHLVRVSIKRNRLVFSPPEKSFDPPGFIARRDHRGCIIDILLRNVGRLLMNDTANPGQSIVFSIVDRSMHLLNFNSYS